MTCVQEPHSQNDVGNCEVERSNYRNVYFAGVEQLQLNLKHVAMPLDLSFGNQEISTQTIPGVLIDADGKRQPVLKDDSLRDVLPLSHLLDVAGLMPWTHSKRPSGTKAQYYCLMFIMSTHTLAQ